MDPADASLPDLLAFYRQILREPRVRGVLDSDDEPTAGYTEVLAAAHYQGSRTQDGTPWDVLAGDGRRVKLRALIASATGEGPPRALRAIKSWDFDILLVVLFDNTYGIAHATEVPASEAEQAATFAPKNNGYVLMATDDFLDERGTDVTEALRRARLSV